MKRILPLFLVAIGMLVATPAFAQDPLSLKFGIGLKGGLNGAANSEVPEDGSYDRGLFVSNDPNVFPMFGMGGAVGPVLNVRIADLIGLETGVQLSYDNANGYEDQKFNGFDAGRVTQEQRTTSLHVPVVVQFLVPGAVARPVFGLGVEFVSQSSTEFSQEVPSTIGGWQAHTAETSSYVLGMLTAGLEFNLGVVRVPLELRLGYNLQFGAKAADRVREDNGTVVYNGAYQGHFMLYTGIVYDYELLL